MRWIFVVLIMSNSTLFASDALAPHPLYFTGDGKPVSIKIDINGQWYEVNWDGASLDLEYGKPPPYDSQPPKNGNGDYRDNGDKFDWAGFWFIVIGSIIAESILIFFIWWFS